MHSHTIALQGCGGMEWEEKVRACPFQENPLLERWEGNEGVILPWVPWAGAPTHTRTVCPALEPFPHSRAFHTSIIIITITWESTTAQTKGDRKLSSCCGSRTLPSFLTQEIKPNCGSWIQGLEMSSKAPGITERLISLVAFNQTYKEPQQKWVLWLPPWARRWALIDLFYVPMER